MAFSSPRIRTGYSFRKAVGKLEEVADRLEEVGHEFMPMTDRASTFGFHRWAKLAEKRGRKPVFGVELAVSDDPTAKKPNFDYWTFIPESSLRPIHELIERATIQFRYQPLLTKEQALSARGVRVISGKRTLIEPQAGSATPVLFGLGPSAPRALVRRALAVSAPLVAVSDNVYSAPGDAGFYDLLCGREAEDQTYDQFIQNEEQWLASIAHHQLPDSVIEEALANAKELCAQQTATLLKARLPIPDRPKPLKDMCVDAAEGMGVDLNDPVYAARLDREIGLITDKGYDDYFYIVADICQWARERMFVGPARGSSCGSLVCYLLGITTVDPIPHGLIFERFIDINRDDMPDIDIDFSDQNRHLVFDYIRGKYGAEHVARLGTVAFYHPRSILQEAGAGLQIPRWKCENVADTLIERSSGDSRALDTLLDTLKEMPAGQVLLRDHPEAAIMPRFEGHPRHYSQHAAGVVISDQPISEFVAVDHRTGATMCDKKDAEDGYNLLKIDALGLTQLSVFEDALRMAGLPIDHLESLPLDDPAAFEVLNKKQWSGIFQFNGMALQSLANQTRVNCFEDIVAITALARPGPLTSGGASEWVYRKNGWDPRTKQEAKITYPHPLFEPYMNETYGVVMFQEQVMEIGRNVGDLSWADVTALRKAMSKSLGKEYFDQFGDRWKDAAEKKGIDRGVLDKVWDELCAYGAWAFNKSHSVAYGLISYWCCWMKAHHPFEFAAATLSHESNPDKQRQLLREMAKEGFGYVPVDPVHSIDKWTIGIRDGKKVLVGPLSNVKGIGPKLVQQSMGARRRGEPLPDRALKLLNNPKTPIDDLYPIESRIKTLMPNPMDRNILTPITKTGDISEEHTEDMTYLVCGVAEVIAPRNENEPMMVARRGYRLTKGPVESLNLQIKDDSGVIYCKIGRYDYEKWGKSIVERGRAGKAIYAVKGSAMAGRRFIMANAVKYIGDMENEEEHQPERATEDG